MGGKQVNKQNSSGRITSGVKSQASILSIITFVSEQLPFWRNDPNRLSVQSEDKLNSQLYKFLNSQALEHLHMFLFGYEERQYRKRKVDISVSPIENIIIEALPYTIYDPVLVFECKRLPAPSVDREKEYVTGTSPDKITGGIQRFKLGFHGAEHNLAAMIGYVQDKSCRYWQGKINEWILELVNKPIGDGCIWTSNEILNMIKEDASTGVIHCLSSHNRTSNIANEEIGLHHLWVVMNDKKG